MNYTHIVHTGHTVHAAFYSTEDNPIKYSRYVQYSTYPPPPTPLLVTPQPRRMYVQYVATS